jgi:hypothetical protein
MLTHHIIICIRPSDVRGRDALGLALGPTDEIGGLTGLRLVGMLRQGVPFMVLGYYWIVSCKNQRHHRGQNLFADHRIPLCLTDEESPRPELPLHLNVLCDNPSCRHVDRYDAAEVMRWFGQATLEQPHLAFQHSGRRTALR